MKPFSSFTGCAITSVAHAVYATTGVAHTVYIITGVAHAVYIITGVAHAAYIVPGIAHDAYFNTGVLYAAYSGIAPADVAGVRGVLQEARVPPKNSDKPWREVAHGKPPPTAGGGAAVPGTRGW